jgi:hypothetical protein
MLTDGLLTAGSPMSSISNGSLSPVAVFSMGFGTGLDVDYPTLQSMVDKGRALSTQQVFHGENAGTIDKFYSNALAAAIGFTTIFDPVVELFGGEYTHIEFQATSADDTFLITAQGMDFNDDNWSFHLEAPDGTIVYGDAHTAAEHGGMAGMGCAHCCRRPHATAQRSGARLSLLLQRDSADRECWVGRWRLMASYRARLMDAMVMFPPDSLMAPVAAGPLRGPRYARLLVPPKARRAQRNIAHVSANPFDILPPGANLNDNQACDLAVNVYARTRLRYSLEVEPSLAAVGDNISVRVAADILQGNANTGRSFARLISPVTDIAALAPRLNPKKIKPDQVDRDQHAPSFDAAKALAQAERKNRKIFGHTDRKMPVAVHDHGPLHVHIEKAEVAGPYHLAIYIEGDYCPDQDDVPGGHAHVETQYRASHEAAMASGPESKRESFTRLLTTVMAVAGAKPRAAKRKASAVKKPKRPRR